MNFNTPFYASTEGLNVFAKPWENQTTILYKNMEEKAVELYALITEEEEEPATVAPCRKLGCYCAEGNLGKSCPFLAEVLPEEEPEEEGGDDDEDVWTDIDSDEEEEEEEEDEEEAECDCHEVTREPLFEIPANANITECVICMDDIKGINMMVTRCGHAFHASCCIAALVENNCCPLCRTQLI